MRELRREAVRRHLSRPQDAPREIARRLVGQRFEIIAPVHPVVGVPARRATAVAEVIGAVEMPFADVAGGKAGVAQALAERRHIEVRRHVVAEHAVAVRIEPRENRQARRPADRRARISAVEAHAASGEAVDVGRAEREPGAITAHAVCALRIDEKKADLSFCHSLWLDSPKFARRGGATRVCPPMAGELRLSRARDEWMGLGDARGGFCRKTGWPALRTTACQPAAKEKIPGATPRPTARELPRRSTDLPAVCFVSSLTKPVE